MAIAINFVNWVYEGWAHHVVVRKTADSQVVRSSPVRSANLCRKHVLPTHPTCHKIMMFFFLDGSHDWWNCRHNVGWSLRPPLGPRGLLRHSGGVWVWPRVHSELHRIRYCEACSCSSCSGKDFWHCSYVKRASFCPNSSTTRLLVQKLDQVYNKETTKALKLWPFGFPRKGSV